MLDKLRYGHTFEGPVVIMNGNSTVSHTDSVEYMLNKFYIISRQPVGIQTQLVNITLFWLF